MMMTTAVATQLSESLQALVDSRLDTIDRLLMGRLPRQDRLAIVKEVEDQVFELLQERGAEELSREDVLAVLARLDPPEAYLPEEPVGLEQVPWRRPPRARPVRPARGGDPKVAKVSGILGLVAVACVLLLIPLVWLVALALGSEEVLFVLGGGTLGLTLIGGILAIVLAIYSRMGSAWAVVGVVTGALSLFCCFTLPVLVFLLA
jgi:hypothetical protein